MAASRVAGGEDMVEGGQLVIDKTGAYGGRFVATKDGFAVEEFSATEMAIVNTLVAGVADDEHENEA